jgi:NitT/TauT family transport system substrate-binding protein
MWSRIISEGGVALRKRFVWILAVIVVAVVVLSSFVYISSQQGYVGQTESITVGNAQSFECDTLVYVAAEQGLFTKNGLNVSIQNYTSGAEAVDDLLLGKVDIAATAEFPIVRKAFNGENLSAVANIGKFQLQDLMGRKDRGIDNIGDFAGKRIGVALGTISEFYLGRFLDLNGMNLRDVTIVNVDPSESVTAIVNGSVDALIIWQPYAYNAEELLGDNATVFPVQSDQRVFIAEVARNDWIAQHPDLVARFVKSLAQAEDYVLNHSSEVKATMQRNLNYTAAYMAAVWGKNEFSLTLDQSLVAAMEDEARWMITNHLTNETSVPNFLNYIYVDGLKAMKPEAVNIIG